MNEPAEPGGDFDKRQKMGKERCKMKRKAKPTRREFIEGAVVAGAAFAFAGWAKGGETNSGNGNGDSQKPLVTDAIGQPDEGVCSWVGFSPVNDQAAFVAGAPGETSLYITRAGRPDSFNVLWEPEFNLSVIHACAWSPNGKEIAFLVQAGDEKKNSKSGRVSIFVADVASGAAREPMVIAEITNGKSRRLKNVSYKKNISWWNNACVCVPTDKGREILKFDTHTGRHETLVKIPNDMTVSNLALARNGELRFIKYRKLEGQKCGRFLLSGMKQDGTVVEYGELSEQLGQIFNARLSQDGEYVFAEKHGEAPKSMPMLVPRENLIYKIGTRSVIGQIPVMINTRDDIYYYLPMAVRNDNELVAIEMVSLAVDGSQTERNHRSRAVKVAL
ncbi:MAG: hypothetical protein JW749_10690 [Sedimentisphaerales bacterium]|nr:hypothetical protein [Sedimentisphaerales bacterium]